MPSTIFVSEIISIVVPVIVVALIVSLVSYKIVPYSIKANENSAITEKENQQGFSTNSKINDDTRDQETANGTNGVEFRGDPSCTNHSPSAHESLSSIITTITNVFNYSRPSSGTSSNSLRYSKRNTRNSKKLEENIELEIQNNVKNT